MSSVEKLRPRLIFLFRAGPSFIGIIIVAAWDATVMPIPLPLFNPAVAYGKPINRNRANQPNAQPRQNRIPQNPSPLIPSVVQTDIDRIAKALETANAKLNTATEEQRAAENLQ